MKRVTGKRRWLLTGVLVMAMAFSGLGSANAADEQPNAGGGTFSGEMRFGGNGIPPLNTPCRSATFTFAAAAVVTLANGSGSQGTWPLTPPVAPYLSGSGSSTCENATVGGGLLTVDAINAQNPVLPARLTCTQLHGAYTRTLTDFAAVLGGRCGIDSFDAGPVAIYVKAQFLPTTGNGVTTNVTTAGFAGSFTVVPA